jgi:diamine N-acetyltransferase
MEIEDLESIRRIHNDPGTLIWLTDIFHVSKEEQLTWFNNMMNSRINRRYSVIKKDINEIIAVARLDKIDSVNRNAEIGLDVSFEHRRKGYAIEIYNCLIDYAFKSLNLHRLSLVTLENNLPAINLYTKLGFKQEGQMSEAIFRDSKYINLVSMYLLNPKDKNE